MIKMNPAIAALALFALLTNPALQAQEAANVRVQQKLTRCYNKRNYNKMYGMFSPGFRRSMDRDGLEYFMDYELHDRHKNIRSVAYLRNEEGAHVYLATFEKGRLELHLGINDRKQITELSFVPHIRPREDVLAAAALPGSNRLETPADSVCDRVMRRFSSEHNLVGLVIGIIKDGKQYEYGYGETQKTNQTIPNRHTICDLASVSKTFTGLLLATAVEQGLVKPDDDIRTWLPGGYPNLSFQHTPITLAHLVSHTSALPRLPGNLEQQDRYDPNDPYCHYTTELLLNDLKTVKLTRKPGSKSEYSNYGMAVCGLILEQVFHKPYAQLVTEYITAPNGMTGTFVGVPDSLQYRSMGCYAENCDTVPDWHIGNMASTGGISSTLEDMLKYMVMNAEEKTPALRLTHVPLHKEPDGNAIGYSWVITKLNNGHHLVWHNGGTSGSSSFCGYIKETGTAVVILNNSETSVDDLAINLLHALQ